VLRELEEYEVVLRKVDLEVHPKVEHSLTSTGEELTLFIQQLRSWGKKQMEQAYYLLLIFSDISLEIPFTKSISVLAAA
jgi:DNA-binding HxlR family transcriptional regulator